MPCEYVAELTNLKPSAESVMPPIYNAECAVFGEGNLSFHRPLLEFHRVWNPMAEWRRVRL